MQFCTFKLKYSNLRISVSNADMTMNLCVLYSTLAPKFITHRRVCAMSSVYPVKSNVIAVLLTLAESSIGKHCAVISCIHIMYVGNTMHATLHICCQIQWTQSGLSYAKSRPSQIQRIFSFVYSVLCIQTDVSPHLLQMCRQFDTRYTPHLLPNTGRINWFALCQLWTLYMQRNCCFTYSVSDIWINFSPLL